MPAVGYHRFAGVGTRWGWQMAGAMATGRRLPKGQSDFPRIREDGLVYVDKTDLVWRLAHEEYYVFLSRPRRFGKSLLVSTFEAYFQGRRDLFAGLRIDALESDWTAYPVLRLDMSVGADSYDTLVDQLSVQLSEWESDYVPAGVDAGQTPGTRFRSVVRAAYAKTGRRVVVLVDEYDAPLQASVLDTAEHERIRALYRDFFAVLKSETAAIRFCFLTGIAKFTQLSIFSVLNNLSNISFMPRYEAICGITEAELTQDFAPELSSLARSLDTDEADALGRLRALYDGYVFCAGGERLYNPYSVVSALANGSLEPYWYSSGQSSALSRMLGEVWHELPELEGSRIAADDLRTSDFSLQNPQVLLYQLGYLTIDHADGLTGEYVLRFPNTEVREALYRAVLPTMASLDVRSASAELRAFRVPLLRTEVGEGDVEDSLRAFSSVLASMPHPTGAGAGERHERDAQLVLVTLAGAAGFGVTAERHSLGGRADVVIESQTAVLVVELKMDSEGGLEAAREQLRSRGYAKPYLASGKAVFEVAVELSRGAPGVSRLDVRRA